MRGTAISGASAAALLLMAGCGADTEPDASEPGDTEAVDATEVEQAVEDEAAETESEDEDDDEGVAAKDRDFSDDPILEDREFTGRMTGDVTARIGEPVELDQGVFEGIGDYVGTVTLTELSAGDGCYMYDDEVSYSTHGFIVYATFLLEADGDDELHISDGDFRWGGSDVQIADYETWQCMDYINGVTDPVRSGESRERVYVFDVPDVDGTLTYRGATHYVDWEIERGDFENAERIP
ncbi:hypothetical protein [Nesterenkonia suensis]